MDADPIVEEVRRHRAEYAAQFDFDLRAMCEDLRKQSAARGVTPVTLPPRRPQPSPAPAKKAG